MKRILGVGCLAITPITFGAWAIGGTMWGDTDEKNAIEAIKASIDEGITSIDTAPVYGFGYSETLIGKALHGVDRSQIQILTKVGLKWDGENKGEFAFEAKDNNGVLKKVYRYAGRDSILEEINQSLKRLQTDYVDLIQLHWPDATTSIEESMYALEAIVHSGKAKAAAVCNYNTQQLQEAEHSIQLCANQIPFSMLRREAEENIIPYAIQKHMGVIAYSPLERGLLTGKYANLNSFSDTDHRKQYFGRFDFQKVVKLTQNLSELAQAKNCTTAQLVLAWTIHQPGITAALAGARNAKQATENARALQVKMHESDFAQIKKWILEFT